MVRRFIIVALLSSTVAMVTTIFVWFWKNRGFKIRFPFLINKELLPRPQLLLDVTEYRLHLIDEESQCEEFCKKKLDEGCQFIGLDCEWVNDGLQNTKIQQQDHYPVALLQLAFPNKDCALIRLCKIDKVTPSLAEILNNKSCLKFGVGILRDANRLAQGFNVSPIGCVDLRNMASRCGIRTNTSLAGLTNQIVQRDLNKSLTVVCSNWEQNILSIDQINYAAADAIAGLLIFKNLISKKLGHQRGHCNLNYTLIEDNLNDFCILQSEEGIQSALSLCQGIVDLDYKENQSNSIRKSSSTNLSQQRRTSAYSVRQTPLYHNCQLIAPDGTLLSTVDIKKVDWYLSKKLGVLESEDPPRLRLLFEPAGKPSKDREYYLVEKENLCVVCGTSESYIRKNIVPHEYRKHFPSKMKEHLSHDVLLLCVNCHQISSRHDGLMKKMISFEYCAPLEANTQKYHEDPDKVKLRSLARALSEEGRGHKLPEWRRIEIMEIFAVHYGCQSSEVTEEMIQELTCIETRSVNKDYISHGELVVKAVKDRGELKLFQRKWRQHFVDTMQPRFLPKLWSVEHDPK